MSVLDRIVELSQTIPEHLSDGLETKERKISMKVVKWDRNNLGIIPISDDAYITVSHPEMSSEKRFCVLASSYRRRTTASGYLDAECLSV